MSANQACFPIAAMARVLGVSKAGAHLGNDHASRDYWRAVQGVLGLIAPRPGPGNLNIYRFAELLINRHGAEEAWRLVMKQADQDEGLA